MYSFIVRLAWVSLFFLQGLQAKPVPVEPILTLYMGAFRRAFLYSLGDNRGVLLYLQDGREPSLGAALYTDIRIEDDGKRIHGNVKFDGRGVSRPTKKLEIRDFDLFSEDEGVRPISDDEVADIMMGLFEDDAQITRALHHKYFSNYAFLKPMHGTKSDIWTIDRYPDPPSRGQEFVTVFPRSSHRAFLFHYRALLGEVTSNWLVSTPVLYLDAEIKPLAEAVQIKTTLPHPTNKSLNRRVELEVSLQKRQTLIAKTETITHKMVISEDTKSFRSLAAKGSRTSANERSRCPRKLKAHS